jgi:hypothetical protein
MFQPVSIVAPNGVEGRIHLSISDPTEDSAIFEYLDGLPKMLLAVSAILAVLYTSASGMADEYEVGPGKEYAEVEEVPWEALEGGSRTLDLVDGDFFEDPDYRRTFVYGNVLVKPDVQGNNQVVHYGGDSDQTDRYRKGVLYFFHNTVVSHRSGTTSLFRLSSDQERVECHNNVVYTVAPGRHLALLAGAGQVDLYNNWLKEGWRKSHSGDGGTIRQHGRTLGDEVPGFIDVSESDFRLANDSPCRGAGAPLPESLLPQHRVRWQYLPHRQRAPRDDSSPPDLGAPPAAPAAR